jgi:hypothetical protein
VRFVDGWFCGGILSAFLVANLNQILCKCFITSCITPEHEASSDPSARLTSIFQRKHPRDVANCPVGISNDLSDEVDDAVRDFTSSETSGGGSYEPPTEFRTDGTLEASNSGLRLLNSLFSHSGTCKDVSGAMDCSHQQKKCFKMKKPWICGEIHGKTVYKIENRLG